VVAAAAEMPGFSLAAAAAAAVCLLALLGTAPELLGAGVRAIWALTGKSIRLTGTVLVAQGPQTAMTGAASAVPVGGTGAVARVVTMKRAPAATVTSAAAAAAGAIRHRLPVGHPDTQETAGPETTAQAELTAQPHQAAGAGHEQEQKAVTVHAVNLISGGSSNAEVSPD
jgi:hypothetical protein